MILKGEMSMLNVLHLQALDVDTICAELKMKRDGSPQFFMRIPIIIDCAELDIASNNLLQDFTRLKKGMLDLGFAPIGVRNESEAIRKILPEAGWTVMPVNVKANANIASKPEKIPKNADSESLPQEEKKISTEKIEDKEEQPQPLADPPENLSLVIDRPVRSGQQIYAAGGDLTILAATSAGSEVMADGSIHVYGALRGRVLAGVKGNESARIFCQSLQAELIVIAGRYQLLDESDTQLIGKPARIHLEGEKLIIKPLS